MAALRIIFLTFSLLATVSTAGGHNITEILSAYPEYKDFNDYLSRTKLNDEINSREPVTVLVFNNTVVSEFAHNQPFSVVKTALSIHILLDFFDCTKLHTIPGGTMITTTFYQTTGIAAGSNGLVNITDFKGGKVGFGSLIHGSKIHSFYTRSVNVIPYTISVLEIDSPILAARVFAKVTPSPPVFINSVLEKAGCGTFAKLLADTGLVTLYDAVAIEGITVFAPPDAAFTAKGSLNLNKLTNAQLLSLLMFHAVSGYNPRASLKMRKNPLRTLAATPCLKFELTVRTVGDSVSLFSGIDSSRIQSTVVDLWPVSIFTIENVLVPIDILVKPPAPEASGPIAMSANATTSSPPDGYAPANRNTSDGFDVPVLFLALVMVSISGIIFKV